MFHMLLRKKVHCFLKNNKNLKIDEGICTNNLICHNFSEKRLQKNLCLKDILHFSHDLLLLHSAKTRGKNENYEKLECQPHFLYLFDFVTNFVLIFNNI